MDALPAELWRSHVLLEWRNLVLVEKARLARVGFLGQDDLNPFQLCFVDDLLDQSSERYMLEILPKFVLLFPTKIMPNNDRIDIVLDASRYDQMGYVVEVVFDPPVTFPTGSLALVFIELSVNAL